MIRQGQPEFAPLFIVGPARSGTTLIYQAIVYSFDVSYLSNLMVSSLGYPALMAKILSYVGGCEAPRAFDSQYGKTRGWRSPAQGHQIWSRWFPKEGERTKDMNWGDSERRSLVGTVSFIEESYNAPFVSKWPGFSVSVLALANAFPESLFIRVQRDPVQNAQSVLKGRRDLVGNPSISISRVPGVYQQYADSSYIEQVCAYVLGIEEQLNHDARSIGEERVLTIEYEGFCLDPRGELARISRWYDQLSGHRLQVRKHDVPQAFAVSTTQKVTPEEVDALTSCLTRLSSDFDVAEYVGRHS